MFSDALEGLLKSGKIDGKNSGALARLVIVERKLRQSNADEWLYREAHRAAKLMELGDNSGPAVQMLLSDLDFRVLKQLQNKYCS